MSTSASTESTIGLITRGGPNTSSLRKFLKCLKEGLPRVIRLALIARRQNMLRKIRNTLLDDEVEWVVRWLPEGWLGLYEGDKITINVFDLILPTIIHESLHHINDKWSEREVERMSNTIYQMMSQRQKRSIIKLFFWRTNETKKKGAKKARSGKRT